MNYSTQLPLTTRFAIAVALVLVMALVIGFLPLATRNAGAAAPVVGPVDTTVTDEAGLFSAVASAPTDSTQYVIAVDGTIVLNSRLTIPANTNIVFTGGGTVSGSGPIDNPTAMLYLLGHLILDNITITHNQGATGRALFVASGGLLDMLDDALITGNSHNSGVSAWGIGAAVAIINNGTFNMWGGTISDNHATGTGSNGSGGAVTVGGGTNAHFNMYGGLITQNTGNVGSAVYFGLTGGNFTMEGGTLSHNTAYSENPLGGSGTVAMYGRNATFIMNDGLIDHNTAYCGGGVAILDGEDGIKTFTMNGGTISNNTAMQTIASGDHGGGGVTIFPGGGSGASERFTMTGGTITGNYSNTYGGGICLLSASGTFTAQTPVILITGGTISDNEAALNGGGIYATGGPITGGFEWATVTFSDATMSGNRAATGAGFYDGPNSRLTILSGTISDNIATGDGGGVYTNDYANLIVGADAIFEDNKAVAAFGRNPADDAIYVSNIAGTHWTVPFDQGYNNFDINSDGEPRQQVVWFDTNGGSSIAPEAVAYDTPATRPADPTRPGYIFEGWFIDPALTIPYDFSTPVTSNITLYAKWEQIIPPIDYFSVTYHANGGIGSHVDTHVADGSSYTVLTAEEAGISRAGYTFVGWNSITDGSGTWYMPGEIITISGDLALYAQWVKGVVPPTPPAPPETGDHLDPAMWATLLIGMGLLIGSLPRKKNER